MTSILACVLVLLVGSACSDSSEQASSSTTTTTLPTTTTTLPTTTPSTTTTPTLSTTTRPTTTAPTTTLLSCDLTGFTSQPRRNDTVPPTIAGLTGVRAGRQDCYERVVFDFKEEALPQYEFAVASPPFTGPPGEPIPVAGNAFIRVRFGTTYARYPDFGAYTGPDSIVPGFAAIKEIRLIEDFEAVVVWVIGLDTARGFRVGTLSNPARVYIDVAT